jgi:hypothetical protein
MTRPIPDKAEVALEYPDKFSLRGVNAQRKRNSNRSPISAAIVGILAGSDGAP